YGISVDTERRVIVSAPERSLQRPLGTPPRTMRHSPSRVRLDTMKDEKNMAKIFAMADMKPRLPLPAAQAAAAPLRVHRPHRVDRLRGGPEGGVAGRGPPVLPDLLAHARRLQAGLGQRAERALHDLDARRTQIVAPLETQAAGLVQAFVKHLNVASREEVESL